MPKHKLEWNILHESNERRWTIIKRTWFVSNNKKWIIEEAKTTEEKKSYVALISKRFCVNFFGPKAFSQAVELAEFLNEKEIPETENQHLLFSYENELFAFD